MTKSKLGQMFIDARLIDKHQLASALAEQRSWGGRLGDILVSKGWAESKDVLRLLSDQLSMPVISLEHKEIEAETLDLITVEEAEKYCCMPLFVREEGQHDVLYLALDDPTNLEVTDNLAFRTGLAIHPVLASTEELVEARVKYYGKSAAFNPSLADPEVPFDPLVGMETDAFKEKEPMSVPGPVPEPESVVEETPASPVPKSFSEPFIETTPESISEVEVAPPEPEAVQEEVASQALETAGSLAKDAMKFSQNSFNVTSPHLIAQAVASLLIEKGLVSAEELTQRIEDLWVREMEDKA